MSANIYFAAGAENWVEYEHPLKSAFAASGLQVNLTDNAPDPGLVDYIIFAPGGVISDFIPFTACKAVLNLWAGVERIVTNPTLTQPLARMVNNELTEGMVEYVVGHTLRHHLGMDAHLHGQDGIWRSTVLPPLARERPVAVLGLGALGQACALALSTLNFPVMGWSRTEKNIQGIECHSGDDGLDHVLSRAEIMILLMPQTAETTGIINERRLTLMPKEAVIINPGRGALIDDDALLAAVDTGHIGHATLDVFCIEPLPPTHRYWAHPRITVTPHIAADTRVNGGCKVIVENIRRGEAGQPFLHLVDRTRGY